MGQQSDQPEFRPIDMCVRCKSAKAPEPLGLCGSCVMHTRVEVSNGFALFDRYLAAWAAFDRWLDEHRDAL
jgi:hypothetical protein